MKAHSFLSLACSALVVFGLSACGNVSSLQNAHGKTIRYPGVHFTKVTVQDFGGRDAEVLVDGIPAGRRFANRIASQLMVQGGFASVTRNSRPDADTLVISGYINDVTKGVPAARALVGLGAGAAFFSADVFYSSPAEGRLGVVKVRKNSGPIAAPVAAKLDPAEFMTEGATKVASEARKFRSK